MAQRRGRGQRGTGSRSRKQNREVGNGTAVSARTIASETEQRTPVELPARTTVGDLAETLETSNVDTIKALMRLGVMATVNETVEFEVAAKVAASFNIGVLKPRDREESAAAVKPLIGQAENVMANCAQEKEYLGAFGLIQLGLLSLKKRLNQS